MQRGLVHAQPEGLRSWVRACRGTASGRRLRPQCRHSLGACAAAAVGLGGIVGGGASVRGQGSERGGVEGDGVVRERRPPPCGQGRQAEPRRGWREVGQWVGVRGWARGHVCAHAHAAGRKAPVPWAGPRAAQRGRPTAAAALRALRRAGQATGAGAGVKKGTQDRMQGGRESSRLPGEAGCLEGGCSRRRVPPPRCGRRAARGF
jgi:hypothetical protein